MPELPEVQTVVDDLRLAGLPGTKILSSKVYRNSTVRPLSPAEFTARVRGLKFQKIDRYGKYILFGMNRETTILAHLRMTGHFNLTPASAALDPHDRLVFTLDNGSILRFHDTRTFGRVICTTDPSTIIGKLGPDAIDPDLTAADFYGMLRTRRRQIKALLLDQEFIAGLGNIYCDEALFSAGIHPLRLSDTLDEDEGRRLYHSFRSVLQTALQNRGTSLGNGETNYISGGRRGENRSSLRVYGRQDRKCPRCGTLIEKIYVGQRGTHFCPVCQPCQMK